MNATNASAMMKFGIIDDIRTTSDSAAIRSNNKKPANMKNDWAVGFSPIIQYATTENYGIISYYNPSGSIEWTGLKA